MKDITILDNFINDEELEETRQFIGEQSLNLYKVVYDENEPAKSRKWVFFADENVYKKIIIDLRPIWHGLYDMKNMIPSVKQFILKIKNRINKCMNKNFDLQRVYLNRQVRGQDVTLHIDDNNQNAYTLLIYIGDITCENYDKAGGNLEFKNKENTRVEPFTKRAVLFKGYIPHKAYGPLVPGITRISMAFKLIDTSIKYPFCVNYS
jgi:hypothetical protein